MRLVKAIAFFCLTFFLFFLLAKPATALNSPQKISTSTNESLAPAIITDSNGRVHTVWMDAPNGWSSATTSLLHSFWNGNSWSAPAVVATGNYHELPSLAADSAGNIYLTWDADINPSAWQVYYSKYNGSTWSAPVAISGSNSFDQGWDSEIAIDSSGNPHVIYTFISGTGLGNERYTYYTKWSGSAWTTPINLSESGITHQYPTLAADKLGKVQVAWKITAPDNSSYEIVGRTWNGSIFTTTASVTGTVNQINDSEPRITVDNANNAHLVWEERVDPNSSDFNIKYSKWTGTWSSPFIVSAVAQETAHGVPSISILPSSVDDVIIGWIDKTTTPLKLGFRKFVAATSSWELSRMNDIQQTSADFPVAAMDKWDNVHVAWGEFNTSTSNYDLYYDAIPLAANTIGPSGGTLTTFNGDTLTFASGTLPQNTIISAQIAPLSQTAPVGSNTLNRQYIFEPTGLTFNPTVSVVFRYTDAEVAGIDERTLGIYVWDPPTSSWVFKTGTVNRTQNRITIALDHFSTWGIFGTQNIVQWGAPIKDKEVYEINKGKTVPIKFRFTENGIDSSLVKLLVVNNLGRVVTEVIPGLDTENLRFDPSTGDYITNFKTDPLEIGSYQIKVSYLNLVRGGAEILLK